MREDIKLGYYELWNNISEKIKYETGVFTIDLDEVSIYFEINFN